MQSGAGAISRNTRYMRSTAPACAWRQPVRALARDVGDDDALRRLVRDRERVDVVARGGEFDERYRGDARPAVAAVLVPLGPAPLHARVAGVDAEDHATLARSTRALR